MERAIKYEYLVHSLLSVVSNLCFLPNRFEDQSFTIVKYPVISNNTQK